MSLMEIDNPTSPSMAITPVTPADYSEQPPSDEQPNKRRRKKSIVWEHFTIETVGAGCMRAVCKQCKKSFAYITGLKLAGTSHLKRHIALGICPASRQRGEMSPCTPNANGGPPKKRQRASPGFVNLSFDQNRCTLELAKMIIQHDYPLNIVEHPAFVDFVKSLQPQYSMVNFNTIEGECVGMYLREKQYLLDLISEIPARVNLTLDLAASNQDVGYALVTGHFIDREWNLQRQLLNVIVVPFPDSDYAFNQAVVSCLTDWQLENKLFTLTVDRSFSTDAMTGNLRGMLSVRNPLVLNGQLVKGSCFARVLSRLAQDAIGSMGDIVRRIRESVKYVKTSEAYDEKFAELRQQLQVPSAKELIMDDPTKWNTTYRMLVAACELKEVFSCMDPSDPVYNINLNPSIDDWKQVEVLCTYLKFFFDAANLLTSSVRPLANSFYHEVSKIQLELTHAAISEDPIVNNLTRPLKEKFDHYWRECFLVLALAVVMDPRFKMKLIEFSFSRIFGEEAGMWIKTVDDGIHELFYDYIGSHFYLPAAPSVEGGVMGIPHFEAPEDVVIVPQEVSPKDVAHEEVHSQQVTLHMVQPDGVTLEQRQHQGVPPPETNHQDGSSTRMDYQEVSIHEGSAQHMHTQEISEELSQEMHVQEVTPEEMHKQEVPPQELQTGALPSQDIQAEAVVTQDVQAEAVVPQDVQAEAVVPQEIQSEAVVPQDVQTEAVEPKEIQSEAVEPKHIQSDRVVPQDVKSEVLVQREIQTETVEMQDVQTETVEMQDVQIEAVEPQEIQSEAVAPPEEMQTELVPPQEVISEVVPSEELQTEGGAVLSQEVQAEPETLPSKEMQTVVGPQEEARSEVVPSQQVQTKSEAVPPQVVQAECGAVPQQEMQAEDEAVPPQEVQAEAVMAQEVQAEVVQIKEMQTEALPSQEMQSEAEEVQSQDMQVEAVPPQEVQVEAVPEEEKHSEEQPAAEMHTEEDTVKEVNAEEVLPQEINADKVPEEEMDTRNLPAAEIDAQEVPPSVEEVQPKEMQTKEVPPKDADVQEVKEEMIHREVLQQENGMKEQPPQANGTQEQSPREMQNKETQSENMPTEELPSRGAKTADAMPQEMQTQEVLHQVHDIASNGIYMQENQPEDLHNEDASSQQVETRGLPQMMVAKQEIPHEMYTREMQHRELPHQEAQSQEMQPQMLAQETHTRGMESQDIAMLSVGDGLSDFDVYISEITSGNKKSELDQYLEESLLPRVQEFDVLEWWKLNKLKYPTLSKLAADILSMPISTVSPDSVFDTENKTIDSYRSSLRPVTLEALVCAKDWLQRGSLSPEMSNALVKME